MTEFLPSLAVVLLGLLLSGFFSGYETGVYCLNRFRLRLRASRGEGAAIFVQRLTARPHHIIASILLGTNISVYAATAALTGLLARQTGSAHPDVIATVILAPLCFAFGEVIPKNMFRRNADWLVMKYRWPAAAAHAVLSLPAAILSFVGAYIGSLGSRRTAGEEGEQDPLYHISEARERGFLSGFQDRAAENILKLSEKKLRDVMLPIGKATTAAETATVGEIRRLMAKRCFSRVPVYSGAKNNPVGFVHILDLPLRGGDDDPVKDKIRPPFFLPADTALHTALGTMQSGRRHMVMVTERSDSGESRSIGIVTLKDIIEEIVGELAVW